MQSAFQIFDYPEFWAFGFLAFLLLYLKSTSSVGKSRASAGVHAPRMISLPAMAVVKSLPQSYVKRIHRMQNWANWRANIAFQDFSAIKLMLAIVSLVSAIYLPLYQTMILAITLFFVPDLVLLVLVKRRQQQIRDALPQALDLMVLCVDAGLGLDATLQRISNDKSTLNHALNDELSNLGRDILLGMERPRAYQELYKRTGVDELKMLGSALNQCTKMGLSIAKILRNQADFLRTRQNQKAEEKAAKLPVWMSFPMWFCIMPALMLVIIGPSLITLLSSFSNRFSAGMF
jgi:tight adherence protein C